MLRWLRKACGRRDDATFLADCHRRLDALLQPAIAFWKRTVDWEQGGFFGLVDYSGRSRPEADKDMIQQARHLWTFSYIFRFEDDSAAIKEICDHQLAFVRDRLYVPERADFHRAVSVDGVPLDGAMHLYPIAFGIYGLAGYAVAFAGTTEGREALRMATDVFRRIVDESYDDVHGFDERVYPGRWCMHAKEINTQMHLMEAVTELLVAARAHGDPAAELVEAVLQNQLTLIVTKGIANRRRRYFCSRGYAEDWSVVDDAEVDYGHDIEVVHLIMTAAGELGREHERAIVDRVVKLGRSVTKSAYDRVLGKWFYSGNPLTGQVLQRVSNIWVNFEALNGLSIVYQLTGAHEYLEKFERVLTWLESKQINEAVGEWYYNVDDHGRPVDHDVFNADCGWMTFPWKSSYHSLRALITRKQWIEQTCPTE